MLPWLFACLAGALLLFRPLLAADMPLLADDYIHVAGLVGPDGLDGARLLDHFVAPKHGGFYRPVFYASYALEYLVGGTAPLPYYVGNVLLHGLVAWLVLLLLLELGLPRAWGLAAMLLFLVHPIHLESVCWVAGRTSTLGSAFFLAALVAFVRFRRRGARGALAGLALAFVLGALSREEVLVLPAVLLVVDRLLAPGQGHPPRRLAVRLAPHLLSLGIVAGYFATRQAVGSPIAGSWLEQVGTLLDTPARQSALLAGASRLALPYVAGVVGPLSPMGRLGVALPTLVLLGLSLKALRQPATRRAWIFGAALLVLGSLPVLPVLEVDEDLSSSRLLYLPSVGLCVLLGAAALGAGPSWRTSLRRAALLAALVGGATLLQRNQQAPLQAGREARDFLAAVRGLGGALVVVPYLGGQPYAARGGRGPFTDAEASFEPLPVTERTWGRHEPTDGGPEPVLLIDVPRQVLGVQVFALGLEQALLPLFGEPGVEVLYVEVDAGPELPDGGAFFGALLADDVPVVRWDGRRLLRCRLLDDGSPSLAARALGRATPSRLGVPRLAGAPVLGPGGAVLVLPASRVGDRASLRYRLALPMGERTAPAAPTLRDGELRFDPGNDPAAAAALAELDDLWRRWQRLAPSRAHGSCLLAIEELADDAVQFRSRPVVLRWYLR